ncbi:unnamed protein product [Staurois parvus]|uniref:Uncharacterized protein n=1 Tax=Staurois parvus TaxID=386267 RepID=A0ABN9F396_9NEOB|nr:unnamed protein product [Staurois parvus]
MILHFQGENCMQTIQFSPLSAPAHCFAWLCIAEPCKAVCLQLKALTQPIVKPLTANS